MSTAQSALQPHHRVPATVRVAQALNLVPLGLLQLAAAIYFTLTAPAIGVGDRLVAGWAIAMSAAGIVVAIRLGRGDRRTRRIALCLLMLQLAFAAVKLVGYGESAALVFGGIAVAAIVLLNLPVSRRVPAHLQPLLLQQGGGDRVSSPRSLSADHSHVA